jgi:hypothetical protein
MINETHEKTVRLFDNPDGIQADQTHDGVITPNREACKIVSVHQKTATFFDIQRTVHRDIFL